MASDSHKGRHRPIKEALEPISNPYMSTLNDTLHIAKEVVMGSLQSDYRRSESVRILSDLAPSLMQPRIMAAAQNSSSARGVVTAPPPRPNALLRLPTSFPAGLTGIPPRATSNSLAILEAVDQLTQMSLDRSIGQEEHPSLIRGFRATVPSSELPKQRRRLIRGGMVDADLGLGSEKMGLKRLGDRARGLLTDGADDTPEPSRRRRRRHRRGGSFGRQSLKWEDLVKQADEIALDKENLHVRTSLIHSEINEVSAKIDTLEEIRRRLEASLLRLQEERLELDDELEGVQELLSDPNVMRDAKTISAIEHQENGTPVRSSRRRKGPAFLPSEHDELPPNVAFMTMRAHEGSVTALDFNEPYGLLVTGGDDGKAKVWDLCDGTQIGELRGHFGAVKALQVEDTLCLTGGTDGNIKLWDLRIVEEYEERRQKFANDVPASPLKPIKEIDAEDEGEFWDEGPSQFSITSNLTTLSQVEDEGPCVRTLEGHSKAVTALYYEDRVLVTGSQDKTIRVWSVETGRCEMTMDLLSVMSNPPDLQQVQTKPGLYRSSTSFGANHYDDLLPSPSLIGLSGASLLSAATSQTFSVPTPVYSDGSWRQYEEFVSGLQSWGYALVSGSGDGAVRMWDLRSGQAHRTLLAHSAPVTCLQFDENHIISGSLDRTMRIWDIRTGTVIETHRYEFPVTSLGFDSRRVLACTGEPGIELYNRTSHKHQRLTTNGHTSPAERLRFSDRYLVSGDRGGSIKAWAL
ncbi:WD40-repeat-containing domain protein [Kockovaella imperatae]|uniref:WD40-repeat-containing domain protein n=1 Tax=Kockovaella imperatae TaxID=4999 RepID=A0A1Y1U9C8_9TREE|nr:WD40-repeat-containing domain protein [Kockovaella imperatae]ORX34641.1 WD40-repeat-containing domain protein [Kockovaella imperatae]